MASVRSRDSRCELLLRRALWRCGLRYRLHARRAAGRPLVGSPDLTFVRERLLVFIDGDFWHGRVLIERGEDALSAQFRPVKRRWWVAKITGNVQRDRAREAQLSADGWDVIRVWETDVLRDVDTITRRIAARLMFRRSLGNGEP